MQRASNATAHHKKQAVTSSILSLAFPLELFIEVLSGSRREHPQAFERKRSIQPQPGEQRFQRTEGGGFPLQCSRVIHILRDAVVCHGTPLSSLSDLNVSFGHSVVYEPLVTQGTVREIRRVPSFMFACYAASASDPVLTPAWCHRVKMS
ncbi:MAG TPA: hypothetical protein VJ761_01240 [Ktedonobacteraceae bacterium]|nr:hypothetical protein [Ktedonobacteraceae bacterium]